MLNKEALILFLCFCISFPSFASGNYKLDVCNKVLLNLCNAWGIDSPKDRPRLVWKTTSKLPLWATSGEIKIDESFYDICTSLGADSLDALAVMLGHELHHIVSKDKTRFKRNLANLSNPSIVIENDADMAGAFTAYLAGYKTKGIMPRIFEEMYNAYQLKDVDMNNYPSLRHRKSMAQKVDEKVEKMIVWFESATYLTAIGEYAMAVELLECLVKHYPNAEVYNNLGVAQLLLALRLNPGMIHYAMPFELETDSELFRKGTKVLGFTPEDAPGFVLSAISNFEIAKKVAATKKSRELAYINLASAYVIDEKKGKAEMYKIAKEQYWFSDKGKNTMHLLFGVMYAQDNDKELAQKKWTEAAEDSRLKNIVKYNQQVLKIGIPYVDDDYPKKRPHFMHDLPSNAKKDIFRNLCSENKLIITRKMSASKKSLEIYWSNSNAVDLFLYRQKIKNTSPSSLQEIELKYPEYFSIPTRKGQIIRIEEKNLLFILKKDIVVIWCKYNR